MNGISSEEKKLSQLKNLMASKSLNDLNEKFEGISGLFEYVNSSPLGIVYDVMDLDNRKVLYGKNEMAKAKTKSFFRMWLEAFNDFILILLIVLAIISLIIAFVFERGEDLSWMDGTTILGTVLAVTRLFIFF
jgi:magnesium-transporting ATPase (P-type)